jgi:hypothetical protein
VQNIQFLPSAASIHFRISYIHTPLYIILFLHYAKLWEIKILSEFIKKYATF